jgi:uncharacterized protein YbjQ (UPF0145 family)
MPPKAIPKVKKGPVTALCIAFHPPTVPATVRIYNTPPAKHEQIALVQSDNLGTSGFTQQGRVNSAMKRLRENAARFGANGIILKGIEDGGGPTMVSGYSANGVYAATAIPTGHLVKKVSGVAIWAEA